MVWFFLFLTKKINIIVCWLKSYQRSCICRITVTLLLLVHADTLIRNYMMINFKTVENLSKLTYTWYLHNIWTSILTTLSIWINFTNSLISLWYVMTRVTISVFSKKKVNMDYFSYSSLTAALQTRVLSTNWEMPSTEGQFLGLNQMIHCIYKYFAIPFKCMKYHNILLLQYLYWWLMTRRRQNG